MSHYQENDPDAIAADSSHKEKFKWITHLKIRKFGSIKIRDHSHVKVVARKNILWTKALWCLLNKSFLLKRKSWAILVIEILLPILFLSLLVALKYFDVSSQHHGCHFVSDNLPSMGLVGYFQSLLCNFNHSCFQKDREIPIYLKDTYELLQIFSKIMKDKAIGKTKGGFLDYMTLDYKYNPSDSDWKKLYESIEKQTNKTAKFKTSRNTNRYRNFQSNNWATYFCFFCGTDEDVIEQSIIPLLLVEMQKIHRESSRRRKGTVFCDSLTALFEKNLEGLSRMRQFMQGKIMFYPVTPHTVQIMNHVSEQFMQLKRLHIISKKWLKTLSHKFSQIMRKGELFSDDKAHFKECSSALCSKISFFLMKEQTQGGVHWTVLKNQVDTFFEFINGTLDKCFLLNHKIIGFNDKKKFADSISDVVEHEKVGPIAVIFDYLPPIKPHYDCKIILGNLIKIRYKAVFDVAMNKRGRIFTEEYWHPKPANTDYDARYISSGLVDVQDLVEEAVIAYYTKQTAPSKDNTTIDLSRLFVPKQLKYVPTTCYETYDVDIWLEYILPLSMLLLSAVQIVTTSKAILEDKSILLSDITTCYRLHYSIHWLDWISSNFIFQAITCLIISSTLVIGEILPNAEISVVFYFTLSCSLLTLILSLFLTNILNLSKKNLVKIFVLYIVLSSPYFLIRSWDDVTKLGIYILSLFPQVPQMLGWLYLSRVKRQGISMTWANIDNELVATYAFNFSDCLFSLWIDIIFYSLLTWYFNGLVSSSGKSSMPFYYPFTKKYWKSFSHQEDKKNVQNFNSDENYIVQLTGVAENFRGSQNCQIKNMNYKFMKSKTTCLVGYKNSGMTEVISLVLGISYPNRGTISLNEIHSVNTVSQFTYCPMTNILYSNMTVSEHIEFYGALSGLSKYEVRQSMRKITRCTNTSDELYSRVDTLSDGQKRMLSIALAFIHKENIVVVDEPSGGLSTFDRLRIWDMIIKLKGAHTVIISTSNFKEAHVLSDQIVIMGDGEILAHGSVSYMKRTFDKFYSMVFTKARNFQAKEDEFRNKLLSHISKMIGRADIEKEDGYLLNILVPQETFNNESGLRLLKSLFIDKEKLVETYGIESYYLHCKRVEEVIENIIKDRIDQRSQIVAPKIVFKNLFNKFKHAIIAEDGSSEEVFRPTHVYSRYSLHWIMNRFIQTTEDKINNMIRAVYYMKNARYSIPNEVCDFDEESFPKRIKMNDVLGFSKLPHWHTKINQFYSVLSMNFFNFYRDLNTILKEVVTPLSLVIAVCICDKITYNAKHDERLQIHPWQMLKYGGNLATFVTYVNELNDYKLVENEKSKIKKVFNHYFENIRNEDGWIGTRCTQSALGKPFEPLQHDFCLKNKNMKIFNMGHHEYLKNLKVTCARRSEEFFQKHKLDSFKLETNDDLYLIKKGNLTHILLDFYLRFAGYFYGGISMEVTESVTDLIDLVSLLTNDEYFYIGLRNLTEDGDASFEKYWKILGSTVRMMLPSTHFARIYVNNKGYTSSGGYLNMYHTMQLRLLADNSETNHKVFRLPNFGITCTLEPLMRKSSSIKDFNISKTIIVTILTICMGIICSLIPISIVHNLILQKEFHIKDMQFLSGMDAQTYWIGNFVYACLLTCSQSLIFIIIFIFFEKQAFTRWGSMSKFFYLIMNYGPAICPFLYLKAFFVNKSKGSYASLFIINLLIIILTIIISVITLDRFEDGSHAKLIMLIVLNIFPQFTFCFGLLLLEEREYGRSGGKASMNSYEDTLNLQIMLLTVQAFVYLILTIILENLRLKNVKQLFVSEAVRLKRKKFITRHRQSEPVYDATDEAKRVNLIMREKLAENENTYIAHQLYTLTDDKQKPFLNDISFCVDPGECFGLIQLPEKHKKDLFALLTGLEMPYLGKLYIRGSNISSNPKHIYPIFNVVAEDGTILNTHTGDELFNLYGQIRGIPEHRLNQIKKFIYNMMDLYPIAKHQCKDYSPSNRRKICCALALIGNPQVILMCKPTDKMNFHAKEALKREISLLREEGRAIFIVAQEVSEYEEMCDRLGVLLNGRFRFFGSIENLQQNHARGYTVHLFMKKNKLANKALVNVLGTQATVLRHHGNIFLVKFSNRLDIFQIITTIYSLYKQGSIDSFYVHRSTLDDLSKTLHIE